MADRWLTFDCYGTIADWNAGMGGPLEKVTGSDAGRLLGAYHQAELELEAGPGWMPYREVLTAGLASAARHEGISLPEGGEATFVRAWPDMPIFDDAGPALTALREQGWRLAILTNCDDDLFAATRPRLPVPFDLVVTAQQVGSYKPDLGHFRAFADQVLGDLDELDPRGQQLGARHAARGPDGPAQGVGRPGRHRASGQAGRAPHHQHAQAPRGDRRRQRHHAALTRPGPRVSGAAGFGGRGFQRPRVSGAERAGEG